MTREQEKELSTAFYNWWAQVHDPNNEGKNAQRADLAKLRQIDLIHNGENLEPDTAQAMTIEAFRSLMAKVKAILGKLSDDQEEDLVIIAVTLAYIRQNEDEKVAQALGGKEDDKRPMKEPRFLRLMRVKTKADLFDQARRLAAILKSKANIRDLALSLFLWRDEPKVRRNWARSYYHLDQNNFESNASVSVTLNTKA